MVRKPKAEPVEVSIMEIERKRIEVCILGISPFIMHRLSQAAARELLAPKGKKNEAEKASTLKHEPIKEFRASVFVMPTDAAPTLLGVLPTMFKGAMGTAALDMPGTNRAKIGRLITVEGEMQAMYGVPKILLAITRNSDPNRTPDVRSRAILSEWACILNISYTVPMFTLQSVLNLLAAAGITSGVGDWRQEKGSGSYGAFKIVPRDDPDFKRICATQGRVPQMAAMANPLPYNDETSELLGWFDVEVKRRGIALDDGAGEAIEQVRTDQQETKIAKAEARAAKKALAPHKGSNGKDSAVLGRYE